MRGFDKLVAIYSVIVGLLTGATAVLSPGNVYAYLSAPSIAYFIVLSHHPLMRRVKAKLFLDLALSAILIAIVAYRAYVLVSSQR